MTLNELPPAVRDKLIQLQNLESLISNIQYQLREIDFQLRELDKAKDALENGNKLTYVQKGAIFFHSTPEEISSEFQLKKENLTKLKTNLIEKEQKEKTKFEVLRDEITNLYGSGSIK